MKNLPENRFIRSRFLPSFLYIPCLFLLLLASHAIASSDGVIGDRYLDNNDGTLLDLYTGLVWSRCQYGQQWYQDRCTGLPTSHLYSRAHLGIAYDYAGQSDWRLPTFEELNSLRNCYRSIGVPYAPIDVNCEGHFISPAIDTEAFPFIGKLPSLNATSDGTSIDFTSGSIFDHSGRIDTFVSALLVRQPNATGPFEIRTHSTSGGTIQPASVVVEKGDRVSFTVNTTDNNYRTLQVVGCNGSMQGNQFIVEQASGHCVIEARFGPRQPVEPINPNYILHANGLVEDQFTGLVWSRCGLGQLWDGYYCYGFPSTVSWDLSVDLAPDVTIAGYSDWRLPTIEELKTLLYCNDGEPSYFYPETGCNQGVSAPAIDEHSFPTGSRHHFWSANLVEGAPNMAYYFDFNILFAPRREARSYNTNTLLLVRGKAVAHDLSVGHVIGGTGTGRVRTDNSAIDCGDRCLAQFEDGTIVTVDAVPDHGSYFAGWTGACEGQTASCQLSMTKPMATRAVFNSIEPMDPKYVLNDDGTVTDVVNGLMWKRCYEGFRFEMGTCFADQNYVSFNAARYNYLDARSMASLSTFAGYNDWRLPSRYEQNDLIFCKDRMHGIGSCVGEYTPPVTDRVTFPRVSEIDRLWSSTELSGGGSNYVLIFDRGRFDIRDWRHLERVRLVRSGVMYRNQLSVEVEGPGSVYANIGELNCGLVCQAMYSEVATVRLYAQPEPGYSLDHWNGDCTGKTLSCDVSLASAKHVQAVFTKTQYYEVEVIEAENGFIEYDPEAVIQGSSALYNFHPAPGFIVNRQVGGTCPMGQWLSPRQYQTGAIEQECSIAFTFIPAPQRKRLPIWLLL